MIDGFLEIKNGKLHIDGLNTTELAAKYGTPLFVFSESRIQHNIERLKRSQNAIGCQLKLCYAAKAMSTMAILRAVKDADCDIEVNSGGELWKALEIGFRGDQIIFNGTSKEVWELENAINAEIYAIQVDSLFELSLIEETAKRLNKRANVSLRLVPEIETGTHSGLQTALLTSKFGMMPEEAFAAFRQYRDSPHLDLRGIHLHIGSQNPEPHVYAEALEMLFDTLVEIHRETGVKVRHINLGGGFPVNYLRGDGTQEYIEKMRDGHRSYVSDKTELAILEQHWSEVDERRSMLSAGFEPDETLKAAWEVVFKKASDTGTMHVLDELTVLLEPGRSIIADAGICLTTVRNVKERPIKIGLESSIASTDIEAAATDRNDNTDIEKWLLTDAGFNILLSMETYKWYYHMISAERSGEPHDTGYKVAGPLCDGGDVYFDIEGENRLPDHRFLPNRVSPNEVMAMLNCGAYSLAQAMQYNGRFLPAVVLIRKGGEVELVRRRDEFNDLIGQDIY